MKVLAIVEAAIGDLGLRVVDVDCRVSGRSLVRLFIERIEGEPASAMVSLENCAQASRKISAAFDVIDAQAAGEDGVRADWFPGGYDLEVSSPGMDRRLRLRADFERFVGKEVKLKLNERLLPRGANISGTLLKVDPGNLVMKIEKDEVVVALGQIKQANLVPDFSGAKGNGPSTRTGTVA